MKKTFIVLLLIAGVVFGQDEFFTPKTSIGGYGELHYNYKKADGKDATKTLDFHRFVTFIKHSWSEKWSFNSELELEHNFVEGGESTGELELEQAYVNYQYNKNLAFRGGVVLAPVGLINETHEPPTFFGTERPDYAKYIIPTTWFGNGLAAEFINEKIRANVTIMEGLDATKFSMKNALRSGRQKGFKANAEDLMYIGRLDYFGVNGLLIGGSFTYNNATMDTTNNAISIFEAHVKYVKNNFYFTAEIGNISYDKGELESSFGYYADLGYNVGSALKTKWEVIPFFRYSNVNTANGTKSGGDSEEKYSNSKWTLGLSIKPLSDVVIKIDYSQSKNKLTEDKTKYFDFGIGYMF